ncbi:unnamed protein product [Meloidogyne enterolobii]|uniref:Uncharacterized protein n=1 Tax=Meloidogyne enterolobii TaxID=390850 RepID=A0ACB1A9E5_MELEN
MNGFTDIDLLNYRYLVYSNLIQGINQLIEGAKLMEIEISSDVVEDVATITNYYQTTHPAELELTPMLALHIRRVYKSEFIVKTLKKQHEIVLLDSAVYFLENLDRIAENDYKPNHQDILRSRVPTTGICDIEFKYKNMSLRYFFDIDLDLVHIHMLAANFIFKNFKLVPSMEYNSIKNVRFWVGFWNFSRGWVKKAPDFG